MNNYALVTQAELERITLNDCGDYSTLEYRLAEHAVLSEELSELVRTERDDALAELDKLREGIGRWIYWMGRPADLETQNPHFHKAYDEMHAHVREEDKS